MKTIFTTGEVAKICKVAPRTVSSWFDSGKLRGFYVPGSKFRRIPRTNLIQFLKKHGMPLGELADENRGKLLLIGMDRDAEDVASRFLPEDYHVEIAGSIFDADHVTRSHQPDCAVIDFALGYTDATALAKDLKGMYPNVALISLLRPEDILQCSERWLFTEVFRKPFDSVLLAERIRTLVGRKKQLA